jgi:DNA-binding transcriptional regulator YdaS (Cro superfamily)
MSAPKKLVGIAAAVSAAGSQAKLARQLGISQQAVQKWRDYVPLHRVIEVEQLTGIPRQQLVNPRLVDLLEVRP